MTVTRRNLIAGGLSVPALGLLTACAAPAEQLVELPTKSLPEAPTAMPRTVEAGSLPPYGPNGTHYPLRTPKPGVRAAKEIEVACSWGAIAKAIRSLTSAQVAAGAVIRVRPGTLVGNGHKSSSTPVLNGLGKKTWTRQVLICPRDGYGSVRMVKNGFRLHACNWLAFFGFTGPDVGFVLTKCTHMQMGWGIWSTVNVTQGAAYIGLYELVAGFRDDDNDTSGVRPTDLNRMVNLTRYGCVYGPSVKRAGSSAHCDTVQLEGTGRGSFGPILNIDCIDIGSSNAAYIVHTRVSRLEFRHCLVLADRLPWKIYPLQDGDYQGKPNALGGGARDVRLRDSHVVGALGGLRYTHVNNTKINYTPQASQRPRVSGRWTVDSSMTTWSAEKIMEVAGTDFRNESFEQYWGW